MTVSQRVEMIADKTVVLMVNLMVDLSDSYLVVLTVYKTAE